MRKSARSRWTIVSAAAIGAAVLAAGLAAAQDSLPPVAAPESPPEESGADVVLTTDDGMKIAATSWPGGAANGPGVVLLHMYHADRSTWAPLVGHLRARGIDVLAIDLRGHGGSAKQGKADLAPRMEKRDPRLFAEMHRDAIAAVRWLVKEGRCDPQRIALVGASVGCSVAIDTARRYPGETSAVACMTAGAKYLGLDSLAHAAKWPKGEALLLITHASEAGGGSTALHDAIPGSRLLVYDDAPSADQKDQEGWAHGTRMFGRMPLVERTVASFVAARTGSTKDDVVLDGIVDGAPPDGDPWPNATDVAGAGGGKAWAYRVGRRVVFGGTAPAGCKGLRIVLETGSVKVPPIPGHPELANLPKVGVPLTAAVDLVAGRTVWVFPTAGDLEGVQILRRDEVKGAPPALRVVRTETGATFEGEWWPLRMVEGLPTADSIRMTVTFEADVPGRPEKLEIHETSGHTLPSR